MTKSLATYSQVYKHGTHVIGLPPNSFKLPDENYNWFVYAAKLNIYGEPTNHMTLFWVNHDTEECVRYADFDNIIDPTCYPYSMNANRDIGRRLIEDRFAKMV